MDMDFIDQACSSEDVVPSFLLSSVSSFSKQQQPQPKPGTRTAKLQALALKKKSNSNSNSNSNSTGSPKQQEKESIDSLRRELTDSKIREKKLIQEFTSKFRKLHQAAPGTFESFSLSSNDNDNDNVTNSINNNTTMPLPFDEEEMPMDEMAATARNARAVRTMEQLEQKRNLEELKRTMSREIHSIKKENDLSVKKLEGKLKKSSKEIKDLQYEFDVLESERDYFKIRTVEMQAVQEQLNKEMQEGGMDESFELMTQKSSITPLQRLRGAQSQSQSQSQSGQSKHTASPKSRLDSLFDTVIDPNLNSLHQLLQVVERELSPYNDTDEAIGGIDELGAIGKGKGNANGNGHINGHTNEAYHKLSQAQQEFVNRIKVAFETSHREHISMIENLKTELEETNHDLQEGEVERNEILDEKERNIHDLQKELSLVQESVKNKSALEGMLKMVAEDQKSSVVEYTDLKKKLRDVEGERIFLQNEKEQNQKDISALRRVMADLTSEKEMMVGGLEKRLEDLTAENRLLKQKIDDPLVTFDALRDGTVVIDGDELEILREKAARCEELEMEEPGVDVEVLRQELCVALEKIEGLEVKVTNDEIVLLQIEDSKQRILTLSKEKKSLEKKYSTLEAEVECSKLQVQTAEDVLKTAKDVHAREHQLEEELSSVRTALDETMKDKMKQEEEVDARTNDLINQCSQLETKLQALQVEVIEMKEEKLSLKTKVRETEIALERSNRIMSLMQETADTEGMASQAISDLKEQLREKLYLLSKLRYCCDQDGTYMIDAMEGKVHMTLCLLETNVLGINGSKSIAPFDFSSGYSPKEQLLERSLSRQRAENDRIRKNIDELRTEKDQETAILGIELASLQGKYTLNMDVLQKKEDELKVLRSSLKEDSVGYISEDESDLEDDGAGSVNPSIEKVNDDHHVTEMCAKLRDAKETAEKEAKRNADNLAEAKLIISSLEQSNKTITENLRTRLHDSNAAIVSLLDQSKQHQSTNIELKKKLDQLMKEKNQLEQPIFITKEYSSDSDEDDDSSGLLDMNVPAEDPAV